MRRVSEYGEIYFAVRSVGVSENGYHVLQYGFVDSRGEVVMSAHTHAPSPVALMGSAPVYAGAEPLPPESFERMAAQVCAGARLIGFGRMQGGLLPARALDVARDLECAAGAFRRKAGKSAGGRGEVMDLAACLALAGLAAPASDDVLDQALAVRALWNWAESPAPALIRLGQWVAPRL